MAPDASRYAIVVSFMPIPQLPHPSSCCLWYHPHHQALCTPLRHHHPCPTTSWNQAHFLHHPHHPVRSNSLLHLKHLHQATCPWPLLQHPLQAPHQPWNLQLHRLRHQIPCHPRQHHHAHVMYVGHQNVLNLRWAYGYHIESVNLC